MTEIGTVNNIPTPYEFILQLNYLAPVKQLVIPIYKVVYGDIVLMFAKYSLLHRSLQTYTGRFYRAFRPQVFLAVCRTRMSGVVLINDKCFIWQSHPFLFLAITN